MDKRAKAGVAVVSLLLLSVSFGLSNKTLCKGFLPENDLKIPVGDVEAKGISEAEFNAVLDRVETIYGPIVASKGGRLVVNRKWEDPTVNASANQSMGAWYINMYGGLARHQAISMEGFALVACHEIGHHIGGFPKMRGWATNEGGSDYFATLKCLRRVFPGEVSPSPLDPVAATSCETLFPEGADRKRCQSGAMAGHSVAALFQVLRPSPQPPTFSTPDPSVVSQTNNAHPAPQCRLDTYFQGALCLKGVDEELSNTNQAPGACTKGTGFSVGLRPLCWFKPPAESPQPAPAAFAVRRSPDAQAFKSRLEAMKGALTDRGL